MNTTVCVQYYLDDLEFVELFYYNFIGQKKALSKGQSHSQGLE